ncbi:beta strand repeat-containing protein, partial [Agitococcus lubricus]
MTTINGTLDSDFLLGTDTTDEIYGFDGDDTLDGGLGSDTLIGGAGDDSYIIDLTDTVDEKSSGGIDTINVSASYSIFTLAQVENLRLTGNSLSDATGNFLANLIEGNSANNRLTGGYGNDTLVGGLGVDTLVGGFDNDTYWLDNERDVVIEENSIVRLSLSSTQAQANGASQNATFSVDGTKVVFTSTANNLVAGDTNNVADIFIKDLVTGVVSCVSRDASGNQANGASQNATFSADGTKIIFTSTANNLVAGDTNNVADIFIKDLVTGVVSCVSRDASGNQANGASQNATFSVDGTKVIFTSTANNLVSGDTNSASDIFVKDLQTGIVTRLTTNSQGIQADGDTYEYNLSADGKKITFSSYASNLINGDTNFSFDIFVKDLQTGLVSRVSTSTNGTQANYESYRPIFAPDGQKVLFQSAASNLIVGDNNNALDYFVKDLNTGELICVTRNVTGQIANGESQYAIFSKDGKKIIFDSYASNLVSGDTNSTSDIFVKNLENGDVIRINLANNVQLNNQSIMPVLSNDGGKLLFTSSATNLVAGDSNNASDIFIIDLNDGHDIVYSSAGHFLEDNVENLTLIGDNPIYAIGNGLNNIITGNAGNNAIDGGVGIDTLIGGQGNDTYEIDNVNDIVIENENEGIDTINAAFSMSLVSFSNVENLFLSNRQTQTNGTGNHLNNVLSGATNSNNSHNVLDGGAGNDTLDGGSGIDTLIGGTGDDTYIVDSTTDTITELLAQGTDTIQSTVNFSLSSILHVENISLKGQASNAVGNSLDNVLIGNSLNNTLSGMDGNDTLIGGTGIDTLVGGVGNDTYFVDSTSDTINELSNQGIDTINASVNFSLENYTNIENITLSGMASEAIGNSLDNIIIANSASNILDGASGIDTVLYSLSWSNYFIESLAEGARIKINDDIDILKNIEYIGFNGHVLSILEAINDAPIAFNDNVSELLIEEGIGETGISIRTGNVLTNDTDADLLLSIGEILSVSGVYNSSVGFVTTGRYGDLVLNSDGSYSYILNNNDIDTQSLVAGQSVIDSFTYTITDIHGLSSSAILTFNIQGSDDVTYITGTANNDDLLGTDTNDNIDSLAGNDTLNGGGGADTLLGGMGNDVIMGNEGDDNIDGGADADLMSGGLGNDV